MADEAKEIELLPCRYQAPCRVKNCHARATTIARTVDSIGRPLKQYGLCTPHAEQVAEREKSKGREILKLEVGQ
jgi:hypothetical protein